MNGKILTFLLFEATSSASSGDAPFSADDFLKKLIPNFWSFVINFVAMIVLFIAVYLLAYKPVKKYLKARQDYVEHNLRDSEQAKAMNEAKVAEGDQIIADAKTKANAIVEKAKGDANASSEALIAQAEKEAQARQKAADEAIKQEEEKSRRAIHDEIVNVALDASKQVLGREVTSADNAKLVSDFADQVKGEKNA
jgi:F-type H+-transporting ATPase subunit b